MRLNHYRSVFAPLVLAAAAGICSAQATDNKKEADKKPDAAAAPAPAPVWSVGPIDFSGLVDAYYSVNFNHPASRVNGLRNFDVKANQFSLNMAKLTLEHAADPVGFRVDFGFGRAFEIIHATEPKDTPSVMRNVEQAYVSLKPPKGKGFQLDFGKFVTSAGAEVIETHTNWNYSRSLLFAWAIPYYHFGARASMPVNGQFTIGAQLVNGWNNVEDNNAGKTVGLTSAYVTKKVSWFQNYYAGPESAPVGKKRGMRHLYDTTLLFTPDDKFNAYVNFDYGQDRDPGKVKSVWNGLAAAAKFQASPMFAISPRIEFFSDHNGFSTGTAQRVKEFTLTGEAKMKEGMFTRIEYRHDWSNVAFFERGSGGLRKNQDTFLIGFVAYFGPKR
jgi:hypothetical protein